MIDLLKLTERDIEYAIEILQDIEKMFIKQDETIWVRHYSEIEIADCEGFPKDGEMIKDDLQDFLWDLRHSGVLPCEED